MTEIKTYLLRMLKEVVEECATELDAAHDKTEKARLQYEHALYNYDAAMDAFIADEELLKIKVPKQINLTSTKGNPTTIACNPDKTYKLETKCPRCGTDLSYTITEEMVKYHLEGYVFVCGHCGNEI
jgi:hypothetical protein